MAQYELNLRDYIRIFRKRRTLITLVIIVVVIASFVLTLGELPSYEAATTVKIEERQAIAGMPGWVSYQHADIMESQAKLISSHKVIKKVVFALDMSSPDSPEQVINKAISKVQGMIKTERIGYTNIIKIIVVADTPEEAINLANLVAQKYKEYNLLEKTQQARSTRQFIQTQLISLESRLKLKEEKLKELEEYMKSVGISDSIKRKLADLQIKLADLLQKYTEKHPLVIQLKEQIEEIESQDKGGDVKVLTFERIKREVDADKKLYAMLKEKLEEARISEAQKVGDVSIVNPAVNADSVSRSNKYLALLIGAVLGIVLAFTFALILESLDTSIATIEDVEHIVKVPVLGVIPPVAIGGKTKTKKMFFNIKRKLLNQPKTEEEERYIHLLSHYDSSSPVAEVYRNVRTNLRLDESRKTILITSAGPKEGKSAVVSNLGHAVAQTGMKTLLISSDIRRPILAKTFGIKREPGLTEVLLGMVSLEEAVKNITDFMLGEMNFDRIQQTPGLDNLWVLTSGQLPFNPAKILESKELTNLIEELREKFDLIIFDSPPVLPVTDASLLAPKMDMVIMVYEIGRTSRDALLRAKNQLISVGAKIVGIILNQTRQETAETVIHPYYYRYKYEEAEKEAVTSST